MNRLVQSRKSSGASIVGVDLNPTGELTPLRVRLTALTKSQWHGLNAQRFDGQQAGDYAVDLTPEEWNALHADDSDAKSRFVPDFMFSEGEQYKQLHQIHDKGLSEVAAVCSMNYIKLNRLNTFEFPCVGVLRRLTPMAEPAG